MIRVSKTGLCVVKQENFSIFDEFYYFYNHCSVSEEKLICSYKYDGNFSFILKEKYEKKSSKVCTTFGDIKLHKVYSNDISKDEAVSCSLNNEGYIVIKKVY